MSVCFHIGNNLATFVIPALSGIYTLLVKDAKYGVAETPVPVIIILFVMFLGGMYILFGEIRKMGGEEMKKRVKAI